MRTQGKPRVNQPRVNLRQSEDFLLCLNCARWGMRGPDPDCSHAERVDLSNATPGDLDEMVEMAERIARRREEAQAVVGLLKRSSARLVSLGRACIEPSMSLSKSGKVVRLRSVRLA